MDKTERRTKVDPLYCYSIIAAAIIMAGSLPIIGWNPLFAYGLALGTCIAVVNYNILVFSSKAALDRGRGVGLIIIGYTLRMAIYGGVFLFSYRTDTVSGIATLLGYLTVKLGMFYKYGFRPGFSGKRYGKGQLKDLDSDPWAVERAQKEKERPKKGILKAFRWEDDTEDKD
jgi:hypothetical protein